MKKCCAATPALRPELLNEHGEMFQHVHMFLNGRDAPFLEQGMQTSLKLDDVVGVFPAVGGGCFEHQLNELKRQASHHHRRIRIILEGWNAQGDNAPAFFKPEPRKPQF